MELITLMIVTVNVVYLTAYFIIYSIFSLMMIILNLLFFPLIFIGSIFYGFVTQTLTENSLIVFNQGAINLIHSIPMFNILALILGGILNWKIYRHILKMVKI